MTFVDSSWKRFHNLVTVSSHIEQRGWIAALRPATFRALSNAALALHLHDLIELGLAGPAPVPTIHTPFVRPARSSAVSRAYYVLIAPVLAALRDASRRTPGRACNDKFAKLVVVHSALYCEVCAFIMQRAGFCLLDRGVVRVAAAAASPWAPAPREHQLKGRDHADRR